MPEKLLKCAVINDLSGYGRCSLTVAIPVLSALGIQACPVPTAVLSNHTDYDSYYFKDFTEDMPEYIGNWRVLNLMFDAIYTGFLGSVRQVDIILDFIHDFKKESTLLFVDPVMGDDGRLYDTYDLKLCNEMKKLAGLADIITPNLTEACYLSGTEYIENPDDGFIYDICERFADTGAGTVIVTGVLRGDKILNFVRSGNDRFYIETDFVGAKYCGTGDVFSSLMCGYLTRRVPLRKALVLTAEFIKTATEFSFNNNVPFTDGIAFEPLLHNII